MSVTERAVRREVELDASPEEVWEALADDRLLSEWLADEVELTVDAVAGRSRVVVVERAIVGPAALSGSAWSARLGGLARALALVAA